MISKGYPYNIVRVQDLHSKIPPIKTVPVVSDFPEVIRNDLLGIPPEQKIDFGIDFLSKRIPF